MKPPFFEGWYYKMVSFNRDHSLAIIPGIYQHSIDQVSSSFIQVVDGSGKNSYYFDFPVDSFNASYRNLDIRIGGNHFFEKGIEIDVHRNDVRISGKITFNHLVKWPVTLTSPGIMGWYGWAPFMECFHGIVSLDHYVEGKIMINENEYDFTDGRGYIEKDWGRAFPEAWIWQQSNHFDTESTCLTASIAIIPWIGRAFPGFIIGFYWDKRLYRFATYTGAKTRVLEVNGNAVFWVIEDKKHVLEISSQRGSRLKLIAPTPKGMTREIDESIDAELHVRLYQKIKTGKTLIFQGTGRHAGFEMEGNIPKLISMWEREK